jgi:hypothetical protein
MKCVKEKETEEISRVYDDRAKTLVEAGTHTFCSKKEWKEKVRDFGKK